MGSLVSLQGPEGTFRAYLARPDASPAPAVVVLHEIFGVNADMRQSCDELAARGYLALCPDLFWRMEPGVELSDKSKAEWNKGFALYAAFDMDGGIADIGATIEHARRMQGASGKVGVMGYCLGGLMTYLTNARHGADALVAYYPGSTEKHLDEAGRVGSPMIMHLAEEDEYMPRDAQVRIRAALRDRPGVTIHSYPGVSHAFARHRGVHFDAASAALANRRTHEFFDERLKQLRRP